MANSNISKGKTMLMLLALGIAGGSIYILPYFRYVFYDQMIEVMNINNTQLGTVSSMYSIVAMILFLFGGVIADKFDAKKLVLISLIGTTILTVIFAFYSEGFVTALIIWAGLAVTTGATFWSAFIKFINSIGDEKDSGKTFGIYYAINGITGAVINAVALAVSTRFSDVRQGFFAALMVVAASTLIATIMIFLFIDGSRGKDQKSDEDEFRLSDIKYVAKNPGVWLLAAFGFISFSLYSYVSYFNPYLIDVIGVSPESSGIYSVVRQYVFMLLAPVGGLMCDKVLKSSAKWFATAFFCVGLIITGLLLMPSGVNPTFASIYTLLPSVFTMSQYSVKFSIIRELHIKPTVLGTAIGLSSTISWACDVISPPIFGIWLDNYGNNGYRFIFIWLIALAVIGIIISLITMRRDKRIRAAEAMQEAQASGK